jgi:hypothetical protein
MSRWAGIAVVACTLASCQVHGDLTGPFTCAEDPRCPSGFTCVAGQCVTEPPDGGTAACATTDRLTTLFDGTELPSWADTETSAGGTVTVGGGELQLTVPANPSQARATVYSNAAYDLRGRSLEVEVTAVASGTTEMGLNDTSGAQVYVGVSQRTQLYAYSKGRMLIMRAYSPITDRWWRLRDDGTNLIWETSADRATWAQLAQDRAPVDLEWVGLELNVSNDSGPAGTGRFSAINPGTSAAVPWCPLASWHESFSDGVKAPYSNSYEQNCTITETGGKLVITTTGLPGSCGRSSTRPLDARDGVLASEVTPAGPTISTELRLSDRKDANLISMEATDVLKFYVRAAGVEVLQASAALDRNAQRFWRLALAGAQVRFEASSDGVSWQPLASTNAPTLDASAMYIERSTYISPQSTLPAVTTASYGELLR